MRWDAETAREYAAWYESPAGAYALAQERKLVQSLIYGWPRRHQRLLDLGCGTGEFSRIFWEAGFDVTCLDASPDMLEVARDRLGSHAECQLGSAEHLPFADKEFDFTVVLTMLEFSPSPETVLAEAVRVSKKGLLVAFLNKCSLYYLEAGLGWSPRRSGLLRKARWFTWFEMRRLILSITGPRPTRSASILAGPRRSWRPSRLCDAINSKVRYPFLGAYAAIRVDLLSEKPLTPIMLWKNESSPAA